MWEVQLVPALVHTAFVLSLMSVAALIAVWAALSPHHRLLRLAGFCILPVALVVAAAPWLAIWLLMEMLPITAVLIVGPFVARAPFGRTWLGLPKVRFGFRDLFFGTFLIGCALSGGILLSKQEYYLPPLDLWKPWVIEPLSLWLPIGGATVLAFGSGARRKRIAWMIVGCILGSAAWYCAILPFGPRPDVYQWWQAAHDWLDLRLTWSLGGLIPCLLALIVAAYLSLWRSHVRRTRSTAGHSLAHRGWGVAVRLAAAVVLVAPAGIVYYELAKPVPITHSDLPTPNGYDRLVAIGKDLSSPAISPKRRDELVREGRQALKLPSLVNVDYSWWSVYEPLRPSSALKYLYRALDAEVQGQAVAGDDDAALGLHLDALEVGIRMESGGVLEDMVAGVLVQRLAVSRLLGAALKPSASQCREGLRRIQSMEQQLEPLGPILDRDYGYVRHKYGWVRRLGDAVESWSGTSLWQRMAVDLRKTTQAWLRVVACDLAVQAYLADHHRMPDSLDELVPEYLEAVPEGPFDGEPIKFLKEPTQYSIWSTEGGQESWPSPGPLPPRVVRPIGP